MKIFFTSFDLRFRHAFKLSVNTRTFTPSVFVCLEEGGIKGYGEATLPPYLEETRESVITYLQLPGLKTLNINDSAEDFHKKLENIQRGNFAAKAALDMAFWDLKGKKQEQTIQELFKIKADILPKCSFTLGISGKEEMEQKLEEGKYFGIYKLKLGKDSVVEQILSFRKLCDKPFFADINQGWDDRGFALEMSQFLFEQGCILLEQPFSKTDRRNTEWLSGRSDIPLIADEAFQTAENLEEILLCYSGVNLKLMKCGGIYPGLKILEKCKAKKAKVILGCMSESSLGVTAASHLGAMADWADLDGPYLISNDPFEGMKVQDERIVPPIEPGLGVKFRKDVADFPAFVQVNSKI